MTIKQIAGAVVALAGGVLMFGDKFKKNEKPAENTPEQNNDAPEANEVKEDTDTEKTE